MIPFNPQEQEQIRRRALEWAVVLSSGEVTANEQAEFKNWLSSDTRHMDAWQNVNRIFSKVDHLNAEAASKTLRTKPISSRRNVLRGLGVLAGVGVLTYTASQSQRWHVMSADYRTATGEQKETELPDGTKIVLNTASAVDVKYDMNERRIIVLQGEILVTTAPDSAPTYRPFIVETAAGDIRAIGTRFSVRRFDDMPDKDISVHVFEGIVEVGLRHASEKIRIEAGQQIQFTRDGAGPLRETEAIASAWSEGKLIAERMRLADFLAELGRYRVGIIRCDRDAADIVISGVFPLRSTDAVLQSLVQALPVRVTMTTKYWVSVSAL